jgi:hypothetical protein
MNDTYRKLIIQFCRIAGVAQPENPDALMPLVIGDVPFFLVPVDDGDGVRLLLTVHYGELPATASALAHRRLLEANAAAFDTLQPKYGIDAETGSVLLTGTLALTSLTAESLAELLTDQAQQVHNWRETRFLTPEERAAARDEANPATSRPVLLRPQPSMPRR